MMLNKVLYYSLGELLNSATPYSDAVPTLKNLIEGEHGSLSKLPFALNGTNVEALWQEFYARFYHKAAFRIICPLYSSPSHEDIEQAFTNWTMKLLNAIVHSYEYYNTLLSFYNDAKTDLMADIKAISENKVYFNDTPQNANTEGIYEGDNYITHFTKNKGENSSPLMSKQMRLKEIQENYKDVMSDWVKEVSRVMLPEGVE